ncbi:YbaB/EbfC family nucleoid-associated protein [Patescibacteria group bacterium]|nr:YbaB/EbfC family nucleoid-associated protein [Patescibacteria group bacterium]
MFNKLKQFKDIRDKAKNIQSKLADESSTSESNGVSLTMDGNLKLTKVNVNADLLNADKKDRLEKAFISAHDDVSKKIQKIMATKMREMGGIPGLS